MTFIAICVCTGAPIWVYMFWKAEQQQSALDAQRRSEQDKFTSVEAAEAVMAGRFEKRIERNGLTLVVRGNSLQPTFVLPASVPWVVSCNQHVGLTVQLMSSSDPVDDSNVEISIIAPELAGFLTLATCLELAPVLGNLMTSLTRHH